MYRAMYLAPVFAGLSLLNVWALDLDPKLVGSWPGFQRDPGLVVRVEGESAYLLSYSHLHVLDISNPRSPVRIRGYDFGSDPQWWAANLWVTEKCAFVLRGDGLHVIDLANPAAPRRIGLTNAYPDAYDLAVLGTNAFLIDGIGLHVLDISNPATSQTVAAYNVTGESPLAVAVAGSYAFVSSLKRTPAPTGGQYRAVLRILDITTPSIPRLVGSYQAGEVHQFQADIAVSGNHAYLLADTLHIIDITDPANPHKLADFKVFPQPPEFEFRPRALALSPDSPHAYVLTPVESPEMTLDPYVDLKHSVESRVEIIDVSHPEAPTRAAVFSISAAHQSIAASKDVLYLTGGHADLDVIDVTDPASLREVAHSGIGDWALDVAVVGEYAYLAEGDAGLHVLDISQPENPRRVGHHPWQANRIVLSGRWAYLLGDDLQIVNLDNPPTPKLAGRFAVESPRALTFAGQHAYLITSPRFTEPNLISNELLILDVTEPQNPQYVGRYVPEYHPFWPENPLVTVAVSGNYAWLAEWGGLSVIDCADPRNPRRVGERVTDGVAYSELFCTGNALYGLYGGGLQIMDVTNPLSPALLSSVNINRPFVTCGGAVSPTEWVGSLGLSISGDYAYLASGIGGCSLEGTALNIVNISDPSNPRGVGLLTRSFFTPNPMWRERTSRMALSGDHLFMADRNAGLQVINVAPTNPRAARFESIERDSNGALRLRIAGPLGVAGRIQRSTNLRSWTDWLPVNFAESPIEVTDPDSVFPSAGYYRLVLPRAGEGEP